MATPLPSAGQYRPRRKPKTYWGATLGFLLLAASLPLALAVLMVQAPDAATLPVIVAGAGFGLYYPAIKRIERSEGRR